MSGHNGPEVSGGSSMGRAPVSGDERSRTPQQASRRSGGSGFESPPPLTSLTLAADLVESVAAQDRTAAEALAMLEAHGGSPDREALSEAVAAVQLRDRFLAHDGDPWDWTGVPRASLVRVWDMAVELAEDSLESHLRLLAVRP